MKGAIINPFVAANNLPLKIVVYKNVPFAWSVALAIANPLLNSRDCYSPITREVIATAKFVVPNGIAISTCKFAPVPDP